MLLPDQSASGSLTAKKVLIVEDEKPLADALEMKLKHEGFAVARATNGQEGLEAVLSFSPDIILLDLMMPVMDGKTMLRRLRDLPQFKTLPVIILTNAGNVDNIRETQTFYNAVEFFIKSNISLEAIVSKIKEFI